MNIEPTAIITTIVTAIGAFLASLIKAAVILELVDWSADQLAGITLVIDNGLAVLTALLIVLLVRARVTPVASPSLPEGTDVTTLDVDTGQATGSMTVSPQ